MNSIPIKKFLFTFLFILPLYAYCNDYGIWQSKEIDDQPYTFTLENNDLNQYILVDNKSVDSFSKYKINKNEYYSASWMGEGGFYGFFIPANSGTVNIEIGKVDNSTLKEIVRLKIITINDDMQLISGLIDYSKGVDLRYKNYLQLIDNFDGALELYNRAAHSFIQAKSHTLAAILLFEIAEIYSETGKYLQAIDMFDQSIHHWDLSKNPDQSVITLNRKGLDLWRSHQLQSAISAFKKVLNLSDIKHTLLRAQAYNNIGLMYWELQELYLAKNNFIESLKMYGITDLEGANAQSIIHKIIQSGFKNDIATTIYNLALVYDSLGSPEISGKIYKSFINLSRDLTNQNRFAEANHSLGVHLLAHGQFQKAKYHFEKSLNLLGNSENHIWRYINNYYLGQLSIELGLYHLAEIHLNQASKYVDAENSPKNFVDLNLKMAETLRLTNKIDQSLKLTNTTFSKAKEIHRLRVLALLHVNKYHIFKSQYKWALAKKELDLALVALQDKPNKRLRAKINVFRAELYLNDNVKESINLLTQEVINIKAIWDTQLLNKANNLLAQAYIKSNQNDKALETINGELKNLQFYMESSNNEKIQQSLSRMLKESLNIFALVKMKSNQSEAGFNQINQMLNRFKKNKPTSINNNNIIPNDLLTQIKAKSVALENNLLSKNDRKQIQNDMVKLKAKIDFSYDAQKPKEDMSINFKSIQKKIDDKTLVIQYSIGVAGGITWWISKDRVETHEISNKKDLTKLIGLAHDEFIGKSLTDKNTKTLSQQLLKPLKSFSKVNKIQLVLDEPLNLVPFYALYDPRLDNQLVLAENTRIKRLNSIQSVTSTNNIVRYNQDKHTSLIVADPVTSAMDRRLPIGITEEYKNPFTRLKGSQKEAKNIGQLLDTKIIQGFDANKERFLSTDLKDKNILHFASHAFFHPEISGLSSIVLSTYNEKGENNESAYLRALDISNLQLNTDLVVLSGCETGVNKYDNSLGLGGLTESFIQAGSKNLIASLWKVSDRVSEQMMTEFYKGYTSGLSIEEALYQAQKMIRKTRGREHPKYWAGWFLLSN